MLILFALVLLLNASLNRLVSLRLTCLPFVVGDLCYLFPAIASSVSLQPAFTLKSSSLCPQCLLYSLTLLYIFIMRMRSYNVFFSFPFPTPGFFSIFHILSLLFFLSASLAMSCMAQSLLVPGKSPSKYGRRGSAIGIGTIEEVHVYFSLFESFKCF